MREIKNKMIQYIVNFFEFFSHLSIYDYMFLPFVISFVFKLYEIDVRSEEAYYYSLDVEEKIQPIIDEISDEFRKKFQDVYGQVDEHLEAIKKIGLKI